MILACALTACYSSDPPGSAGGEGNVITVEATGRAKVNLLVVVNNSGSMAQEQAAMRLHLGSMIRELLDPADADGDTRPDALPIDDLHVGVVSTDMGTMGFRISTCLANPDVGDDGCFPHITAPTMAGCDDTYPTFLERNSENAPDYPPDRLARDFACIGTLGTTGCGFEQQLEALRRAVLDNQGPGRCNEGFLRDDSVLALVVITDENDCSVSPAHSEMFDPDRTDLGHLSIRCWLHPDYLRTVEWFRDQLLDIRPNAAESVVLAEIVGVPPDPLCQTSGASLEACLGLTAMQEEINPAMPTNLIPSCNTTMGIAFPPRRIVELAKRWHEAGGGTYVGSICQEDWSESAAGIRQEIVERLRPDCLPNELELQTPDDPTPSAPPCTVDCVLVELLAADRTCAGDPACPPEACPPTTLAEARRGASPPCRTPDSDTICEPLVRDLGIIELSDGNPFRACLVRQDAGTWSAGFARCEPPSSPGGWHYVPPEWTAAPFGVCPMLELPASIRDDREGGAALRLYCGTLACPFDRQCGPLDHPASSCCTADSTCHRDAATGEGACFGPGG